MFPEKLLMRTSVGFCLPGILFLTSSLFLLHSSHGIPVSSHSHYSIPGLQGHKLALAHQLISSPNSNRSLLTPCGNALGAEPGPVAAGDLELTSLLSFLWNGSRILFPINFLFPLSKSVSVFC